MRANLLLNLLALASFFLVNQVFAIQPGPNRALGWHTKIGKELHQKRQLQLADEKRSINRFNRRGPPPPGGPPPPPPPPGKNGTPPPAPPPPPPSGATVILNGTVTQPLDHFGSTSNLTFQQRYWYSLKHYKPNSGKPTPIYVLDSGEVDASTRLGYLDHGILDILAGATNGIGVVLEHRYYGASYPPLSAFSGNNTVWSVDQLQWLNLDQALEDNAQFVQKMTFQGVAEPQSHFQAPNAPVISYGGSYPGAKSAILRVKYPKLFWGSLASSAVIVAKEEFPEYYWPVYDGTQTDCAQAIIETIQYVDNIIAPDPQLGQQQTRRDPVATKQLMNLFGAGDLTNVADFANMLTFPLDYFQDLNWDPSVSYTQYPNFCTQLVGHASGNVSPAPQKRQTINGQAVPQVVQNYAAYIKSYWIQGQCTSQGYTVPQCYASGNYAYYNDNSVLASEISWTFQTCTQFGYRFTAGPVVQTSNSPLDFTLSGPKMLSALLDLDYASAICKGAFPPGKTFSVPAHPDINAVNKYGGYNIASNRLAFINGQFDPWRPATTASTEYAYGGNRIDSLDTPFKLIPNCWHHCDSNGAANNGPEPPRIAAIHSQEIQFVEQWLSEWPSH